MFRYVFKDSNIFRDYHKIESSDDFKGKIDFPRGIKLKKKKSKLLINFVTLRKSIFPLESSDDSILW